MERFTFRAPARHAASRSGHSPALHTPFAKKKSEPPVWSFLLFFPVTILYMEIVLKITVYHTLFNIGLVYMTLFSIAAGLILTLCCSFFSRKVNRIVAIVLTSLLTLLFCVQVVYYQSFGVFFVLYSFHGAGDATQFTDIALQKILYRLPVILLLAVPLVLLCVFGRRWFRFQKFSWPFKGILAGGMVVVQLVATLLVVNSSENKQWYSSQFQPEKAVNLFGVLTTTRLDIKQLLFGLSDTGLSGGGTQLPSVSDPSEPPLIGPDVSDDQPTYEIKPQVLSALDFEALAAAETDETLRDMHEYFASQTPTNTNEYTGMFEGKNLIWITAEAFSSYAFQLEPELFPNINRLYNEGFQFTNFYTPGWGVSTSDGEYVNLQSLIPKSGVWSMYRSSNNYLPFTLGNQLKALGYQAVNAYHNNSYTYYDRNLSHPNLGYDWYGIGGGVVGGVESESYGLQLEHDVWPNSDLEMMQATLPTYIDKQPFHVYYMTVSGHANYSWMGNTMSNWNRDAVENLPYSETVKAYLAANLELDKAIGYLLDELEKAGIADDTVIAMSADHYPYGLDDQNGLDEMAGHTVDTEFERYENSFLLWCGSMEEPVVVDKVACSMDILPTLSNLMGVEYDSRLMMGTDLLSTAEPLVIFNTYSWITSYGRYNANTGEFTAAPGVTVPDGYVDTVKSVVREKFSISRLILEEDYYRKILG